MRSEIFRGSQRSERISFLPKGTAQWRIFTSVVGKGRRRLGRGVLWVLAA
jgi:hypothetical protein